MKLYQGGQEKNASWAKGFDVKPVNFSLVKFMIEQDPKFNIDTSNLFIVIKAVMRKLKK